MTAHALEAESVFETTPDAIICADSKGIIQSWNTVVHAQALLSSVCVMYVMVSHAQGATTMFGYAEYEAIGKPLTLIIPKHYQAAHNAAFAARARDHQKLTNKPRQHYKSIYEVCMCAGMLLCLWVTVWLCVQTYGLTSLGQEVPIEISVSSFIVKGQVRVSCCVVRCDWLCTDASLCLQFTAVIRDIMHLFPSPSGEAQFAGESAVEPEGVRALIVRSCLHTHALPHRFFVGASSCLLLAMPCRPHTTWRRRIASPRRSSCAFSRAISRTSSLAVTRT